ncbi:uncharacterized protein KY384_007240 [Bacidia gigantensis]|uniref:uncharacterized protein n=1 Tax=Bacidia gigantensis TaxID=2732470 RepID=UPI001D05AA88|nr:uncharacterized protein KY384_007240 [Bacidia gigantensis]KAG8528323.1 hypothetical protein KY384_007240 [Bacidia gigantensis]
MPLHLLPKKSWNVYNTVNVERVRKDEADFAARQEAEEQKLQEEDADRRIRILRGENVSPPPKLREQGHEEEDGGEKRKERDERGQKGGERKRRRLHGEDDTERDLRYAQEELDRGRGEGTKTGEGKVKRKETSDKPLMDQRGHINLFPVEESRGGKGDKHPEVEREKKRKERELEDQYTMRFSNAAGFKQGVGERPWYEKDTGGEAKGEGESVGKDVWGNEDPGRKEREKKRVVSEDPMAMMQRGVDGVRAAERDKRKWREEKEREIRALDEEERRQRRRRKKKEREREEGRSVGHHRRHRSRSRTRIKDGGGHEPH